MKLIKLPQAKQLNENIQMKIQTPKPPSLYQWLKENKKTITLAKRNGHTIQDVVAFLDTHNLPATTRMIEKASSRMSLETIQAAKQITLSPEAFAALTSAFAGWASQRNGFTLAELIAYLKQTIEQAHRQGYDFDDIAEWLTRDGITISARSVKSYYHKGKKASEEGSKRKQADAEPTVLSSAVIEAISEPEPDFAAPMAVREEAEAVTPVAAKPSQPAQPPTEQSLTDSTTSNNTDKNPEILTTNTQENHQPHQQNSHHKPLKHLPVYDEESELEELFNL